jgi:hypothetical protein
MEITDLFERAGSAVAIGAMVALVLLIPLYISQRRDVHRLRAWMEREPDHPAGDIAASEALLDRAETELEELIGEPEPEPAPTPSAATRVTSERPALERITMERAALAPHPRWRRFVARVTQPRALVAIGVAALLLGAAAIFGSQQLLSDDDGARQERAGGFDPAEVDVTVLNGTSVAGLAGKIGSDIEAEGYTLVDTTNAPSAFEQSVVMFAHGQERAAERVAKLLRITAVQPIDREVRGAARDAEVVVITGEDRAQP